MKQISREQANKILAESSRGPFQKAVICYASKWYDIRGMSDEAVSAFIESLVGEEAIERGSVSIEVKL